MQWQCKSSKVLLAVDFKLASCMHWFYMNKSTIMQHAADSVTACQNSSAVDMQAAAAVAAAAPALTRSIHEVPAMKKQNCSRSKSWLAKGRVLPLTQPHASQLAAAVVQCRNSRAGCWCCTPPANCPQLQLSTTTNRSETSPSFHVFCCSFHAMSAKVWTHLLLLMERARQGLMYSGT